MNTNTTTALIAYLEALKAEGYQSIHLGTVIPMHGPQPNLERRRNGLPLWTQFPDLEIPESLGKYDRSSGFVFFDIELYNRSRWR